MLDRWRSTLSLYAAVTAGSVLGSLARWMIGAVFAEGGFPWTTLAINASGSFAIGFFARLTAPDGRVFAAAPTRHFVMTGLCGGYTTFSLFSLESIGFIQHGAPVIAATYVSVSIFAWLGAVWIGDVIALRFNRLKGARS